MIVAIDGPAGAGKSSVSNTVARRLGFQLIDTGALYRCVALLALRGGVGVDDEAQLHELARGLDVRFEHVGIRHHVWLGDEDVTDAIRTPEVADMASRTSAVPLVRAGLLELQRALGRASDVVMEGRDIGTVVFPDAEVKVYLTASLQERARRRVEDFTSVGREIDQEAMVREIEDRDARDSGRAVAPLRQAEDAVLVDSTTLTFEEVVATICDLVATRRAEDEA